MAQNCANVTRICGIKHNRNKNTSTTIIHKKNADRSARLTVVLNAASELKSTVAGRGVYAI